MCCFCLGRLVWVFSDMWGRTEIPEAHVPEFDGRRENVWTTSHGIRELYWLVIMH